jgi:hypothetical protein
MIYCAERFVLLHLPRTSGTSIAAAYLRHCDPASASLIALGPQSTAGFERHERAAVLAPSIPEWHRPWFRRVAVVRNPWRVAESHYRYFAAQRTAWSRPPSDRPASHPHHEFLETTRHQTFSEFVVTHFADLGGGFWRHYCTDDGSDLGVEAFRYEDLDVRWAELLDLLGLPPSVPRSLANAAPPATLAWTDTAVLTFASQVADDLSRFGYPASPWEAS